MHRGSNERVEVRRGVRINGRETINENSEFTDNIVCKTYFSRNVIEILQN